MSFIIEKVSFDATDEKVFDFSMEESKNLIFSVFIGVNGTGKSQFISKLIEIFRDIERKKLFLRSYSSVPNYYYIKYSIDGNCYEIQRDEEGYNISDWTNIIVPKRVLALSFLVEDKYTFQDDTHNEKSTMYKYLGIRSTANASFTKGVNKKITNILFNNLHNESFFAKVKNTFLLLGYTSSLRLVFEFKTKKVINESDSQISTRINKAIKKLKMQKFTSEENYYLSSNDRTNIIQAIKGTSRLDDTSGKYFLDIKIDFNNFSNHQEILEEYEVIQKMLILDLIDIPLFQMVHETHHINDYSSLSSGEKNLLFITLNILANAKNNSLIVIDEPEISLHSVWQVKYNDHLKSILEGFTNIHVVIATHSHFLLSGLSKNEANVFSIQKDRSIRKIEEDTYGWSPENILYRVFGMASTRNHYFEMDLKKLVYYISEDKGTIDEITTILDTLKRFNIKDDDPLLSVILQGEEYLKVKINV